jgi:hypothetical protein
VGGGSLVGSGVMPSWFDTHVIFEFAGSCDWIMGELGGV